MLIFYLQVLKVIMQIIVTYYYVFIALALISLIICYIRYNHGLKSFQLKNPFKDKETISTDLLISKKQPIKLVIS